jgi:hypothetical protein
MMLAWRGLRLNEGRNLLENAYKLLSECVYDFRMRPTVSEKFCKFVYDLERNWLWGMSAAATTRRALPSQPQRQVGGTCTAISYVNSGLEGRQPVVVRCGGSSFRPAY